jgi:streptomycin 6-kinase
MDYSWYYLRRDHRCFGHDPISAIAIASESYPGDCNAVQAALFHIELDKLCTADPRFKKMLEILAKRDAAKRRRKKRSKKAKQKSGDSADYRQIAEFIQSVERIRKLAKLMKS